MLDYNKERKEIQCLSFSRFLIFFLLVFESNIISTVLNSLLWQGIFIPYLVGGGWLFEGILVMHLFFFWKIAGV